MNDPHGSRRRELEGNLQVFLLRLVADLDSRKRSVADTWEPPMTAAGRHIVLAREFEQRLRAFWQVYGNFDVFGERRIEFKESLARLGDSDDAFRYVPAEGCEELVQLRHLLSEIVDAGLE